MFGLLEAQTDRLVNQAQVLFRLPELGWFESIQSEVREPNPARALEDVLSKILSRQYPNQDLSYPIKADSLAPIHTAPPTFSHDHSSTRSSTDTSKFIENRGYGRESVTLNEGDNLTHHSKKVPPLKMTQSEIVRDVNDYTKAVRSISSSSDSEFSLDEAKGHDAPSSIGTSQSPRLLTDVNDLHNLLRALPREGLGQIAPASPIQSQLEKGVASGSNITTKVDELKGDSNGLYDNITHVAPDRDILGKSSHKQSPSFASKRQYQRSLANLQDEQKEESHPTTMRLVSGESPRIGNYVSNPAAYEAQHAGVEQMQNTPSNSILSGAELPPLVQERPVQIEAGTPVTLDSATLELLLEELLDRLEERQRENALRTLGFTGGQI